MKNPNYNTDITINATVQQVIKSITNTYRYKFMQSVLTCILIICSTSTFAQDQPKAARDYTTTVLVNQTPKEAFDAINNVRGWWSAEIEGSTDKLNDEFTYHFKDVHRSQMKIVEFIPNEKVVWLVKNNYFNFTKDKTEWTGTKIIFEILKKDKKTQIRFTHLGLVPAYECFNVCSNGWTQYIHQSLFSLITTGKGQPNSTDKPRTADEKKLGSGRK